MILSDIDIKRATDDDRGPLVITPFNLDQVQPSSVDLTLSDEFLGMTRLSNIGLSIADTLIDLNDIKSHFDRFPMTDYSSSEGIVLKPGDFILGSTIEHVEIPDWLVARVEGKSSLARLGLIVHTTAGYIDPGFKGKITLEIVNLGPRHIWLRPGKSICQLSFIELSSPAEFPYGHENLNSKYQDQDKVTESRYAG